MQTMRLIGDDRGTIRVQKGYHGLLSRYYKVAMRLLPGFEKVILLASPSAWFRVKGTTERGFAQVPQYGWLRLPCGDVGDSDSAVDTDSGNWG